MATRHIQHRAHASLEIARQPGSLGLGVHIVRLATALSCAAGLLLLANVIQDLGQWGLFFASAPGKIWLLDVDSEESLFNWLSSTALFVDALLLFLVASERHMRARPFAAYWYVLAIGFVGLSIDETASLHEKLSGILHNTLQTSGLFAFAWVIPALIFCAVLALFYIPFLRALESRIASTLLLSGLLYVVGAVGVEMIAGAVYERLALDSLPYRMVTSLEETLEISGALLLTFVLGWNFGSLTGRREDFLPGERRWIFDRLKPGRGGAK